MRRTRKDKGTLRSINPMTARDIKLGIDCLAEYIHACAVKKGWWKGGVEKRNKGELLALVHSEISEAMEGLRSPLNHDIKACYYDLQNKPCGFGIELADAIIRILDICVAYEIPISNLLFTKINYNTKRPYRHGNKRA